ncbi:sugar transferase [Bacillus mobilis]|uniref:sugar transferase n=1 Tax=Bacillus mobilis TaxID=2026190 RepID=UPI000A302788|nr:sugar transferase [Bacillus mobilis]MCU5594424.1 sugar transferase [Bacillus mobilis]MCU5739490.1 sugar transferase [Bacillus mobilis]MCU9558181.1 sugar transferase [Bacillus mobilis]SMD73009.1 UDP-N-acetylgalactosamine-undecaprenyl-phosphate N-acetylgalactosaminephosphotransferase [Bacillus mobilis]
MKDEYIKRCFDFLVSLIAIVFCSSFYVIIGLLIKIDSRGPIIFKQIRVGKDGRHFSIYKFRTMIVNAEKLGKQITVGSDNRVTRIGHILRKTKLDELPQLFNVLIGDMSFVGPRPEVPKYTELYKDDQWEVLSVRPGITDYASIKYRNENEILGASTNPEYTYINEVMQDKLRINLEYIKKRSFREDIKIILLTISKIVK